MNWINGFNIFEVASSMLYGPQKLRSSHHGLEKSVWAAKGKSTEAKPAQRPPSLRHWPRAGRVLPEVAAKGRWTPVRPARRHDNAAGRLAARDPSAGYSRCRIAGRSPRLRASLAPHKVRLLFLRLPLRQLPTPAGTRRVKMVHHSGSIQSFKQQKGQWESRSLLAAGVTSLLRLPLQPCRSIPRRLLRHRGGNSAKFRNPRLNACALRIPAEPGF
ncbi:hypothetical protein TREES_T100010982 [Tupaia chinensis]|uniref:Uncharacterized protein n=1 Tax=Tupaia chinensis TaxID=246437 RepID=L9JEE2_TUPCH|nr:hypothetical protein TREES_T100010982 [Tupaia chinensis]